MSITMKVFGFMIAVLVAFSMMISVTFAYNGGQGGVHGDVPRGPNENACEHGAQGIATAIENGGAVECDDNGGGDPNGDN